MKLLKSVWKKNEADSASIISVVNEIPETVISLASKVGLEIFK
jgi:hypothetical protein